MNTLSPILNGGVGKPSTGVVKTHANVVPIPAVGDDTSTILIPLVLFVAYNFVVFSESPFGGCIISTESIELPTIFASKIPLSITLPLSLLTIRILGAVA